MLLKLEHVKKQYNHFQLDVSLQVDAGQVVGLIGANGAGKSTTFKMILGLTKPEDGMCMIFEKPVEQLHTSDREKIGAALSDSGFSGYLTVKDILPIMGAMYTGFSKTDFLEKCNQFHIPLNQKIKQFSTGMKAKLKILIALSYGAELLVLDEPTAGLDVAVREEVLDMLRDYMEDGTKGMVISSHISSDLEGLCDELYMIDNGKILLHEETDVLLSEYGVLKVTPEQYETLEKQYLLKVKKEKNCYQCLTAQKQYYIENYPELVVEKGTIDEVLLCMIRGNDV